MNTKKTAFLSYATILATFLIASPVFTAPNDPLIDSLFIELKQAPDERTAIEIEQKIWSRWTQPDDSDLRTMMTSALKARRWYDYRSALDILDQVVRQWPDYSEGWNQRATIHFFLQNYEASLWDISKALEFEPRHFGALAGRGVIRLRQGKPALAIQNIRKAMEIHPYLRERHMIPSFKTN